MAFLLYFVVILVSAASVLFGLDLMTSPLPSVPNVPIGRSAQVAPAASAAPAAKGVHEAKQAADSRALTPVYPAYPAATPRQQALSEPPEQQAAAAPQEAQDTPTPQRQAAAPPAPAQPPAATPATAPDVAPQPAVAQSRTHCDLQACAAAYHSFRASDCSYQPYPGLRQVCARSGGAASGATRSQPARAVYAPRRLQPPLPTAGGASDDHELDEVTRIVRKMTRAEDGDVAVRDSQGRIIIVHPGPARAYAPYD